MTNKIQFTSLQPEYFASEQMWLDFFVALADVIQAEIRDPITQLEDVRHYVEETDPFIISNTIKMLGFDIPADLIQHNVERLSKAVYMLSMFHEISGVKGFERSIEFVLGREIEVTGLYTNNYVDFYPTPQGPLLADGGDWYATTHISLGMELIPSDRNLILPLGKTLADRLMDAYFEFASITEVVHDFYFITKIEAQLNLRGKVFVNPTRFRTVGQGIEEVNRLKVHGPQTIESYKSARFFADAMFTSNPCFDVSQIALGQADTVVDDADITSKLYLIPNGPQEVTRTVVGGYLWLASPVELGRVTFTDANGFEGGWDGAGWPANGDIGESVGPIVVSRTIDGQLRSWNLYRTDFRDLGLYTFNISFQYNRDSSCEYVDPTDGPQTPIPNPPDEECETIVTQLYPLYGTGAAGLNSGAGLGALQFQMPSTNNANFSITVSSGYGYFAYPSALGLATFTDTATNFPGGWDGASWPANGDIGEDFGPIEVMRNVNGTVINYYVYRTDFPDLGALNYDVVFQNPGLSLTVEEEDCYIPTCVSGYPVLAEGDYGITTDAAIVVATTLTFDSTDNRTFGVSAGVGDYSYFCYPIELGLATFTDTSTNFPGGWDGAGWDNGVGSTLGPIVVQRTVNGVISDWYLYRTDFDQTSATFEVEFEHPGKCVSSAPIEPGDCLVSGVPRYGSGYELYTSAHIEALTPMPNTQSGSFTLVVNSGQYGYFASPAALGEVTFTDENDFEGGWEGARWPVGTIGSTSGPALVLRNISGEFVPWYLYRTDFPALGAQQYTVTYQRNLNVGDLSACNTAIPLATDFITGAPPAPTHFPIYGVAGPGVDNDMELLQLTSMLPSNANQVFNINVPTGQYGYFAHPSFLGIATFTDVTTEFEGGWHGASWPYDGTAGPVNGPIAVLRNIGGVVQTWYVYRTDYPGIGNKQFRVTFGNAEIDNGYQVVRVVEPLWTTDRPDLVVFDDLGVATFSRVYTDTIVHITATYNGISDTISVLLVAKKANLLHMTMLGLDEIVSGQNGVYGLEGFFSDGFYHTVTGATFTVLDPFARFVNNTLFTDRVPEDRTVYLSAKYTNDDGIEVTATKEVKLLFTNSELHVVDLTITGPNTLVEGQSAAYVANILYSNGMLVSDLVLWESSSAGLYIDQQGIATASRPDANFSATIKATFQFNGVKTTATKTVEVQVEVITPLSMSISGPNSVMELNSAQYIAITAWSNGVTTTVPAQWVTSKFSIDSTGLFSAGSVGGTTSLSVQATANGLSAQKIVSVYNTPFEIEHIAIVGADNIKEGAVATYRVLAHYNDGRDFEITATLAVTGSPSFVTLTGNQLSFANATEQLIELVATYVDGPRTFTQRKNIVLIPEESLLSGLTVFGPSEVLESKRIGLSAIAHYSDGTSATVQPLWSLRSPDPVNFPNIKADIVSPGVVQGRAVDEDSKVIVVARYFKEVAEYPIFVRDYTPPGPDVPISYYIEGPSQVSINGMGSYTLICLFENCPEAIALSNDWALDVDNTVAVIDANGYLRSINHQPTWVEVTATWEFNGHYIQVSKDVEIVDTETITTLLIDGPANAVEQSQVQFTAETFLNNQDVIPGLGVPVTPSNSTWSVSGSTLATIDDNGLLTIGDLDTNTALTITVAYNDGNVALTSSIGLLVAGAPAPVVSANLLGGADTVTELSQLNFSVEVFRQGMPTTPGTGILVAANTLVYTASFGTFVNGVYTAPLVNMDTPVTLTITGVYETYNINLTKQITVLNRAISDLLLTGPATINPGQNGQYVAEIFYTGQTVTPGQGESGSSSVIFSLPTTVAGITISNSGLVLVAANVDDVSFVVSATAGSVTKTLNVTVPGVPVFTNIRSVKELILPGAIPMSYINNAARVDSADVMLLNTFSEDHVNFRYPENTVFAIDTKNYSDPVAKTPVIIDSEAVTIDTSTSHNSVGRASESKSLIMTRSRTTPSGPVAAETKALGFASNAFAEIGGVPSDLHTFTYPLGPTLDINSGGRPPFISVLDDGTVIVVYLISFRSQHNGLAVGNLGVLRVYKLVAGNHVHVQDIYDPLGTGGYRTYTVSGLGTSYVGTQIVSVSMGANVLEIGFIAVVSNSDPNTYTSTQRGRTDYWRWDGTKYVRFVAGAIVAGMATSGSVFYRTNNKLFLFGGHALNVSQITGGSKLIVKEILASSVIERQIVYTYTYYQDVHVDVSMVKRIAVFNDADSKTRIMRIDPNTGLMSAARTLTGADTVPPGTTATGMGGMPIILRDGRTVAVFAGETPLRTRIWLIEG